VIRLLALWVLASTWVAPAKAQDPQRAGAAAEANVVVARPALPPCSSHGGFTDSVDPPAAPGTTAIADYHATFTGELSLAPSHAATAVVHPVEGRAYMAERITFEQRRGDAVVLDTELVAFDLHGAGLPADILVRESPSRPSPGRTTITTLAGGRYRVQSFYDVWLEISIDGGRSWSPAAEAVRMSIGPETTHAGGSPPAAEMDMSDRM
jgi:hypothetical protein